MIRLLPFDGDFPRFDPFFDVGVRLRLRGWQSLEIGLGFLRFQIFRMGYRHRSLGVDRSLGVEWSVNLSTVIGWGGVAWETGVDGD